MKIIHCADLHLDSNLESVTDRERASQRRTEMLAGFVRLTGFARDNGVRAVLIAGDFFDGKNISATTRNTVINAISENPEINFYYLKGNHDNNNLFSGISEIPGNLFTFGAEWSYLREGCVCIAGIELDAGNCAGAPQSYKADPEAKLNIVMLHGQESESRQGDRAQVVSLKDFRHRGIGYMALGHIHAYKYGQLDPGADYCYPGCLEGRGFDECGEKGFVLLDINEDTGTFTHEFVPFAQRQYYTVTADVSDCRMSAQIVTRVQRALKNAGCGQQDLVKVILKGTLDVECEKDVDYIRTAAAEDYYFLKLSDETRIRVDISDYMLDCSLKGEFVRTVMEDESLSKEERSGIIRCGLQALAGEKIE